MTPIQLIFLVMKNLPQINELFQLVEELMKEIKQPKA